MFSKVLSSLGLSPSFPKLMRVTDTPGRVVLFTEYGRGVLISEDPGSTYPEKIGSFSGGWVMSAFSEFPADQQVVLSNGKLD